MKYNVGRGGEDEPGLILIVNNDDHTIIARSSESNLPAVLEMVELANAQVAQQLTATDDTEMTLPEKVCDCMVLIALGGCHLSPKSFLMEIITVD